MLDDTNKIRRNLGGEWTRHPRKELKRVTSKKIRAKGRKACSVIFIPRDEIKISKAGSKRIEGILDKIDEIGFDNLRLEEINIMDKYFVNEISL